MTGVPMADDNRDVIPIDLRLRLGRCPFCGGVVQEVKFEPFDTGHFRYTNDCACLHYAVLVVEADGCYYWAMICPTARPADARARDRWDKWQSRDLSAQAPATPLTPVTETTEPSEEFDAYLYEEAQIILSMYG